MDLLPIITLARISEHATWGTHGVFIDPEQIPICVSLELPYRGNERDISCILPGRYHCTPEYQKEFKTTIYRLHEVPGRSGILIHPGNWDYQVQGCILPGTTFDYLRGKPGVTGSGSALAEIRKTVSGKDFILSVEKRF